MIDRSSAQRRCAGVLRCAILALRRRLQRVGLFLLDRRGPQRGEGEAGRIGRLVELCLLLRMRLASGGIQRKSGSGGLGIGDHLEGGWTMMRS